MIVKSGQLLDNDTERFNFSCNCQTWICELTILSIQIEDSGHYFCEDYLHWGTYDYSRVTVLRKLGFIFTSLHLSISLHISL